MFQISERNYNIIKNIVEMGNFKYVSNSRIAYSCKDCSNSCTSSCEGGCHYFCESSCKEGCDSGCRGSCAYEDWYTP